MMSNGNAIVTLVIGNEAEELAEVSAELMSTYASRCGGAFVQIKERRVSNTEAKLEKFQIYELLDVYDRIIYLDIDTLVSPRCPNLFELVKPGIFGAYFDSYGGNLDADIPEWREEEIDYANRNYRNIGWQKHYFNSGVMVVDAHSQEIFQHEHIRPMRGKRVVDQTFLNFRLQVLKLPWMDLGQKFNHMVALSASRRLYDERLGACILHYAGFREFYNDRTLRDQMAVDSELLLRVGGGYE